MKGGSSNLRLGLRERERRIEEQRWNSNGGLFGFFLCSRVGLKHSRVRNNESFEEKECEELIEKSRLA